MDLTETEELSAAAKKCTEKQRLQVHYMVTEGLRPKQAAAKAGYADGHGAKASGYYNLRQPHVQQYMNEVMLSQLSTGAPRALATVARLSDAAKSEYVRLQASQDLLDRAGYKPIDRAQVQVAGDIRVAIDLG